MAAAGASLCILTLLTRTCASIADRSRAARMSSILEAVSSATAAAAARMRVRCSSSAVGPGLASVRSRDGTCGGLRLTEAAVLAACSSPGRRSCSPIGPSGGPSDGFLLCKGSMGSVPPVDVAKETADPCGVGARRAATASVAVAVVAETLVSVAIAEPRVFPKFKFSNRLLNITKRLVATAFGFGPTGSSARGAVLAEVRWPPPCCKARAGCGHRGEGVSSPVCRRSFAWQFTTRSRRAKQCG